MEELPGGGQAAIFLCERIAAPGERVIIKLYYHPASPHADDPRPQLRELPHEHAVAYVDPYFGVSRDGRWWEVLEFLEIGSVQALAAEQGGRLRSDELRELIRRSTDALAFVHGQTPRVIHRDLKPANLLVRTRDPLHVVLADFGLAVLTENSRTQRSALGTDYYMSPESTSGDTRPARDWWALGMCIAELAVGRHPFQYEKRQDNGRAEWYANIMGWLSTKPVPLEHIEDDRLLLLLRGLLTRDPDHRWAEDQVRHWLDGGEPELAVEWLTPPRHEARSEPTTAHRRIQFLGTEFADPTTLARAMKGDWQATGAALAGRDLERLVDWIDELTPEHSIRGDVNLYLAAREGSERAVLGNLNRLIAKIVTRLDPVGEPIFMGENVGLRALSGWAQRFELGQSPKLARVVDELYSTGALAEYAQTSGLEHLERARTHWEDLVQQGERYFTKEPDAGEMTSIARAICLRVAVKRAINELQQQDRETA